MQKTIWRKSLGGALLVLLLVMVGCSGGGDKSSVDKKGQGPDATKTSATTQSAANGPGAGESQPAPQPGLSPGKAPSVPEPVTQPDKAVNQPPPSLGMTLNEFCLRFNNNSERVKSKLRIRKIQIEPGQEQDAFKHTFNENLYLTGKVNKADGLLAEINLVGALNGGLATTVDLNLSIGAITTAFLPNLSQEGRDAMLNTLGININNANTYNLDKKVTKNGLIYWVKSSRKDGLHFGVKNAKAR